MANLEEKKKIVFGLYPLAVLINSLVLMVLAQLIWTLRYIQLIPPGATTLNGLHISVAWYYDVPILCVAMFMLTRWVEYYYKLSKSDRSWRAFGLRYFLVVAVTMTLTGISGFVFFYIFLPKGL
jgi:hypothetical protein